MKETIKVLWREYYGLYLEKYSRSLSIDHPLIRNTIDDSVLFGQTLGQDIHLFAEQSMGIGIGHLIHSFRELQLGSYPLEDLKQTFDQWIETDRLITAGNGTDADNRCDALILFKSGLMELLNAIKIGKFKHGAELAEDGTLQYTPEKSLELRENDEWVTIKDKTFHYEQLVPARVWQLDHNLNKTPSVTIRDFNNMEFECEVFHYDTNITLLTFSAPFAGYADVN